LPVQTVWPRTRGCLPTRTRAFVSHNYRAGVQDEPGRPAYLSRRSYAAGREARVNGHFRSDGFSSPSSAMPGAGLPRAH